MSTRPTREASRQLAQHLSAQGRYPARMLERDPKIVQLAQRWQAQGPQDGDARAAVWEHCRPTQGSAAELARRLRQIKARVSLALFALESANSWPMARCTASLSELAAACLDASLVGAARLEGWPQAAEHVCVMGLGKLGGWELNYGSDVDVVFVCSEQGWAERERMERVLRAAIALMADVTEDGYVFRVDLRLRPDGGQGPLVLSERAVADYYLSWGQTWERSAWLKARPVAGARELGEALLKRLEPFLYKKYLDMQVFEDLRRMKATVEQHAGLGDVRGQAPGAPGKPAGGLGLGLGLARSASWRPGAGLRGGGGPPTSEPRAEEVRDVYGWDVKIGEGGIREIEFFVQALQLVHSGSRVELRVRGTIEALDRLLYGGMITGADHAALADAYTLYRMVEHRVQLEDDQQTHQIPATREGFLELARRMDEPVDGLRRALMAARGAVRAIFSRLFEAPAEAGGRPVVRVRAPLVAALSAPVAMLEGEQGAAWLEQAGFERPRQVAGQLWVMRQKAWGPFGWRADGAQRALAGELMEAAAQSPDPVRAVAYLTRLVTTVGDRPWFWRMLSDNLSAARLVAQVCGASEILGGIVSREPQVVGRLLSSGSVVERASGEEVSAALEERLRGAKDPGESMQILHRFVQEEQLRIGLHELGGAVGITQTMAQLSWLAEVTVAATVRLVAGAQAPRLCVLALGKLGGGELTFGSDLDLLFVSEGPSQGLVRAVQRVLRELGGISTGGALYEADTRLRPGGRQGSLVVPVDELEAYYTTGHAGLWERQAMLKARPLTGSSALQAEVEAMRRRVVFDAALPEDATAQIVAMRARMREGMAELGADAFDVKGSAGGIVDIEFAVQAAQLEHRVEGRGTLAAIEGLIGARAPGAWHDLSLDYVWLRRLEARLRLERLGGSAVLRRESCGALARQMGLVGEDGAQALWALVEEVRGRVAGA
jgi:[glutamine synthetase] adenylyltransferase / [glutamine synthetase]-adenylyl-L-tyrosine phosphorylase